MRSKKALANISTSFIHQLITAICGFIVPRYILMAFGSEVNGLVSSITNFLGYIAIIEGGVGGVTRAALYKPLAKHDERKISGIINATELFFRKIAYVFIAYLLVLTFIYPYLVDNDFHWSYTVSLVVIIGISTFAQYYFGITYQLLLQADQRQYISTNIQIFTILINTFIVILLINLGANIQLVKLGSAVVFVFRPMFYSFYVKRKYNIDKKQKPDNQAIEQRYDGLGHHIAYFIHKNTDIAVLTIFTNIKEVSVYSIYHMIVRSVTNLVKVFSSGIEAAFGNILYNNERKSLLLNFRVLDFISSVITITVFSVAGLMILPFVDLYTTKINDVNYIRPVFAILIIIAEAFYCLRLPYQSVALAAGKFKETRNGAIGEALINIVISLILVNIIGIIGVAIGTLIAMAFRTFQYVLFTSRKLLNISFSYIIKRYLINILNVTVIIALVSLIPYDNINSFINWFIVAILVTVVVFSINLITNLVFFFSDFRNLFNKVYSIIFYRGKNN